MTKSEFVELEEVQKLIEEIIQSPINSKELADAIKRLKELKNKYGPLQN